MRHHSLLPLGSTLPAAAQLLSGHTLISELELIVWHIQSAFIWTHKQGWCKLPRQVWTRTAPKVECNMQ